MPHDQTPPPPHPGKAVWLVCNRCRAACLDRPLSKGEFLRCSLWAFSSAGIICLLLANTNPILHFEVAGKSQQNLVITGIDSLWAEGFAPIAALVFFCTIAAPFLYLSALWYLGASCTLGSNWPGLRFAARAASALESLNLLPVFAVACVVSVVKLRTIGTVTWDTGALWIGVASLFTLLAMQAHSSGQVGIHLEETQ